MQEREKIILNYMKVLGLTREQAEELMQDDANDVTVELTPEQKRVEKEMRQAERAHETKPRKRERKIDNDKRFLIDAFVWTLTAEDKSIQAENVTIVNPEREIEFIYNGVKYKLILSKPRK